jgi:hypothetical protein
MREKMNSCKRVLWGKCSPTRLNMQCRMSVGLRELQNARWRRSAAKTPENKEIGGGESHESPLERKDDGEFCAYRQGRAAVSGLQSSDRSAEPRRNLPKRPENWAFPVIQGDRHPDLRGKINLPSITGTYRWLNT